MPTIAWFVMGIGIGVTLCACILTVVLLRMAKTDTAGEPSDIYDPVECTECHLPGDCPLCGAK